MLQAKSSMVIARGLGEREIARGLGEREIERY
jgi:hypothetical protein